MKKASDGNVFEIREHWLMWLMWLGIFIESMMECSKQLPPNRQIENHPCHKGTSSPMPRLTPARSCSPKTRLSDWGHQEKGYPPVSSNMAGWKIPELNGRSNGKKMKIINKKRLMMQT